jgi:ubiquinone/menaquinone biosynthesis C-methylase UbiE
LLGRDETLGIELMTAASAYRSLMEAQIKELALAPGTRVADLGSGVGSFPIQLAERWPNDTSTIYELDIVRSALKRGRDRLIESGYRSSLVRPVECDLSGSAVVPLRTCAVDRVMASLLFSYIHDPQALLNEIRRILTPGGRLVASSLRRDADISKIYMDGLAELRQAPVMQRLGSALPLVSHAAPRFLNDAAKLLEYEEVGFFQFWDEEEFTSILENAGFRVVSCKRAFGDPPQAIVVAAVRE